MQNFAPAKLLTLISLVAALAAGASAQLTNGGFENGLTGWTTAGNVQIQTSSLGISPNGGTNAALLATATDGSVNNAVSAGSGVTSASLATALNISGTDLTTNSNGTPVLGSVLSKSIILQTSQTLTFKWDFLTNQTYNDGTHVVPASSHNNDFALVAIVPSSGSPSITKLAQCTTSSFSLTGSTVPFLSHTGFNTYTFTAPTPDTYTFAVAVIHSSTDSQDNGVNSALLVDDVALSVVPYTLRLSANSISGGAAAEAIVTFPNPVSSGTTVSAQVDDTTVASVPSGAQSVTGGVSTFKFLVRTSAVNASTPVVVTTDWLGTTRTATLTLTPTTVASLTLNPNPIRGGASTSGVVTLSGKAGTVPLSFTISSDNVNAVVPASDAVPAGSNYKSFAITTSPVDSVQTAHITVTFNGVGTTSNLTINPAALSSIVASPVTSFKGGKYGWLVVSLDGKAGPSGTTVTLSSDKSALVVPASVLVPAGTNYVSVKATSTIVAADTIATVTASAGAVTKTTTMTVLAPTLDHMNLTATTVQVGKTIYGRLYLESAAPSTGMTVTITPVAGLTLPSTVQILPDKTYSNQFPIIGATAGGPYLIQATVNGVTVSGSVTVTS